MITVRLVFPAALLLVTACAETTVRWRPAFVSHVPDSSHVRLAGGGGGPGDSPVRGISVGWQRGTPRLVTSHGDTVLVHEASRPEVRLRYKTRHATAGGIIGYLVGISTSIAACGSKPSCGELDSTMIVGLTAGVFFGSLIATENWVRVKWR